VGNPFGPIQGEGYTPNQPDEIAGCAQIRLVQQPVDGKRCPRFSLALENGCTMSVALLTDPVEIRTRLTSDDVFPAEMLISALYAVVYLSAEDAGLPTDAFRGDGGKSVLGPPGFAVAAPGTSIELKLVNDDPLLARLTPGTYFLTMIVPAVPAKVTTSRPRPIDLSLSVDQHNAGQPEGAAQWFMPSNATKLSSATTFAVQDDRE